MFEVIVKDVRTGKCVGFIQIQNDWMRADMANAIELILFRSSSRKIDDVNSVTQKAGTPTSCGEIVVMCNCHVRIMFGLLEACQSARWEYLTRRGYGRFVEELIGLVS